MKYPNAKIKAGCGFWYVDRHPYGGDFARAPFGADLDCTVSGTAWNAREAIVSINGRRAVVENRFLVVGE